MKDTAVQKAYEDLARQVEIQLHYLDAQDTGPFDSSPLMLQKADKDVRKALENVKKVLALGSE
ncbi:hypothetical protein [Robertmurraya sp.]|uniref:hypothetical protein n=1 Tax=Robertmurraya sp. TaxID=2837525 RepID=UPI003703F61A